MTTRTVIVTDGEQRAALAVVRSLGSRGYRCIVTSSSRASIAGASRFVERTVIVPNPLRCPTGFAEVIVALAAEERAEVVLPIAEQSLLAILPVRARLTPAIVPFPDVDAFSALTDKERVLREAEALGIAIPTQEIIRDAGAIRSLDLEKLKYPLVLKPARSVSEHLGVRAQHTVSYAYDASDLRQKIRAFPAGAFPLLLQQRVVGPGTGIFLLLWNGTVQARFAHRRLTEKPASGGVSVYRESIAIDETLSERSRQLLERFGWRGVAMIEYKIDSATGQPYLMEVNGRFWGSLQLAIDAGVDFPHLLVACALGERVSAMPSYRVGVRSRWWWGQVDHIVGRLRAAPRNDPFPAEIPSIGSAYGDLFFAPFRRSDYEEVLRWTDPKPFLNETVRWLARR